jgi:cytochrome c-type biogenesis protein CcsB
MVAIQDGGRVMPMEGYARRLASKITGREHWSEGRGPEAYSGREPMELLCDLLFLGDEMVGKPLIGIENKPFKTRVGLDPERRFFTAREIAASKGINDLLASFAAKQQEDPQATAAGDERTALELFSAANRIASLTTGERLAIVPAGPGTAFLTVGLSGADPGTEQVREAWVELGDAYASGADMTAPTGRLRAAIASVGTLSADESQRVGLEVFYLRHNPWRMTQVAYGLAIILFGLSRLTLRRPLVWAAVVATAFGVVEHIMGIVLRVLILDRAPVSNTFEALLWMGIVAIAIGSAAQIMNRRSYYLFGGVCAAMLSVLFAGLVPLTDRTNSLPAVLRSNYWLIVHVLTIVASYGVLMVAAVLGHVYLAREVLLRRRETGDGQTAESAPIRSHPLIVQTYRTIQIGLLLLTAGTILGGVWAADSWGRFWGWDPKETWALISIVVYFAVLHARYIGWLQDFGLAAASVLGFVVIVWTFYGVNYVMATGLHSYGFGSGGEVWVGLWAAAEVLFLVACRVRFIALSRRSHENLRADPSTT